MSKRPGEDAAIHLANPTPNGSPRVVLVVGEDGDWLKVLLPIRPNRSVGWVKRADVSVTTHEFSVVVEQAAHRIRVYDAGRVVVDEPVAVGKGSTPTPTGQFFVTDLLQPSNPNGAYGPYAFGLSGYSDVYQKFGSGDGVVGIHGTNDPSSVGRDASHGCIRVTNDVIRHLASFLPLATPVAIRP
ncbi:MAG TPA: L,D-transpeptidase [Acidimicrobiales bacterium]|nr:L,D-transpeptidase [Acidimicrobiales bacterium]